ncbi:MAG: hypothetical protein PHN44_00655 [Candidatus Marinimicrobia bacterium]|nr:hypothetical protein [Candidatus Neomarinimicrobiota bacterium]MDD5539124.1 hypothetical protein [Candidatus Neomarinimicrobiota bacterium]
MARDRSEEQEIRTVPMGRIELNPNEQGRRAVSMRVGEILPGGYDVIWQYTSEPWASLSNVESAARVTSLPQRTKFYVFVPYKITWYNKPLLQTSFTTAVTVSDGLGSDFTDGRVGATTSGVLTGTFVVACVMPERASVTFKIQPWFNPGGQWSLGNLPPKPWY